MRTGTTVNVAKLDVRLTLFSYVGGYLPTADDRRYVPTNKCRTETGIPSFLLSSSLLCSVVPAKLCCTTTLSFLLSNSGACGL
jgi:hypothetical protein